MKIELDLNEDIIWRLEDNAEASGKSISEFLNCHLKNLAKLKIRQKNYYSQFSKKRPRKNG